MFVISDSFVSLDALGRDMKPSGITFAATCPVGTHGCDSNVFPVPRIPSSLLSEDIPFSIRLSKRQLNLLSLKNVYPGVSGRTLVPVARPLRLKFTTLGSPFPNS